MTTADTQERIVGGKLHGLLEFGDAVTFEAVHLGVHQRLTARVVRMEPPRLFADEMVRGAFRRLTHVHAFESRGDATLMRDTLVFTALLGPFGLLAERLFLERYMRAFLVRRNAALKRLAETSA